MTPQLPQAPVPEGGTKRQVMSALRWSAVAKFGSQLVNWSMTLFVMRLLAPADYGLVAMLSIIFMFLGMLGEMGFGSSLVQSPTLDEREIRQTVGGALLINLGICALLMVAAPAIALFYDEPRLIDMTRVAALAFVGNAMTPVYSGLLQREMRFRTSAQIEVATSIIGNAGTLVLALLGFGAWSLIVGGFVAMPLRVILLIVSARKFYWPSFRFGGTRRLWTFGGNVLLTRVFWYWSSQADVLIAGKFLGKEALGFYFIGVHLASLPMQRAGSIINGVAFAAFAKIQHDPRAVAHNTRLGVRLMAFITFPVLWGIAAVAPELVDVVIGANWEPSILPLVLIALTIPFRMIGSIVSTTTMSVGRVDVATVTTIIGACLTPPLFYAGSRYGIVGLSVAWLLVTPLMFMLNMYRALPILGLSTRAVFQEIWRSMTGAGLMFGGVEALRLVMSGTSNTLVLPILIMWGMFIYGTFTWLANRAVTLETLSLLFPGRFARYNAALGSA